MNGMVCKPELVVSDGKCCPYCARKMSIHFMKLRPTKDHILARSKVSGKKTSSNRKKGRVIIVCSQCNFEKGTLTLEEFVAHLKAKNVEFLETIELNRQRIENVTYLIKSGLA